MPLTFFNSVDECEAEKLSSLSNVSPVSLPCGIVNLSAFSRMPCLVLQAPARMPQGSKLSARHNAIPPELTSGLSNKLFQWLGRFSDDNVLQRLCSCGCRPIAFTRCEERYRQCVGLERLSWKEESLQHLVRSLEGGMPLMGRLPGIWLAGSRRLGW